MKKHSLFFCIAFVFSYACSYGMDVPKPTFSSQIKEYVLKQNSEGIACGRKGKLAILHQFDAMASAQNCSIFDYQKGKVEATLAIGPGCVHKLSVHPYSKELIIGVSFCNHSIRFWSSDRNVSNELNEFCDQEWIKCCSNISFRGNSCFFINANDLLIGHNYKFFRDTQLPIRSNGQKAIFTFYENHHEYCSHLFTCPSKKNPYFLCSDFRGDHIYKSRQKDFHFIAKILLTVVPFIEQATWTYSRLGYICGITKNTQKLCVINTRTLKQHVYDNVYDEVIDAKIYALAAHPNQRIFALLLKNRNIWKICFVDSKTWGSILTMNLTRGLIRLDGSELDCKPGQFIAFTPYGKKIIVAIPETKKLFVTKIPSSISRIDAYEKFSLIRYFVLPIELRNLIAWFLLMLTKRYWKTTV